jgi:hypothetical protein
MFYIIGITQYNPNNFIAYIGHGVVAYGEEVSGGVELLRG